MYPSQHVFVRDHIPQPLFQRHLSPPYSALDQIGDWTMRLGPAQVIRYSRQAPQSIGAVLWLKGQWRLVQRDGRPGVELKGQGGLGFALGYRSRGRLGLPRRRGRLQHALFLRDLSDQQTTTLNRLFEIQKTRCLSADFFLNPPV